MLFPAFSSFVGLIKKSMLFSKSTSYKISPYLRRMLRELDEMFSVKHLVLVLAHSG
jgi:hypothetical protein